MQYSFSGPKSLKKDMLARKPAHLSLSKFIYCCIVRDLSRTVRRKK